MKRRRSGMILLEVMLGTVLFAMSSVALVTLLVQTVATVRHGRETERRTANATRLLNRVSLFSEFDLSLRLGVQRMNGLNMEIGAPAPTLFTIDVRDTVTGAVIVGTMVYRPTARPNAP
jgi:type II secretory pathway pseudopilin PulG